MASYDFAAIENKWQEYWAQQETFRQPNPGEADFIANPKLYILDMFPYPSGAGLHVGHPEGYTATDIVSRYGRMKGYNVLHPMGYDSFGLPAEQYAVEHGVHPRETTANNIANIERQIKRFGFSYDWSRRLATTDPDYYRWTQWIFLQLFNSWYDPQANAARPINELVRKLESGQLVVDLGGQVKPASFFNQIPDLNLTAAGAGETKFYELPPDQQRQLIDDNRMAYLAEVPVNWCPRLGTVLANEEVTNEGRSERGNFPVYRRALKQWMLRITAYAQRLQDDLDLLDWPEPIKIMQRNWIGKSVGANVVFEIIGTTGVSPVDPASGTTGVSPVDPEASGTTGVSPVDPEARGTTGVSPVDPEASGTTGVSPVDPEASSQLVQKATSGTHFNLSAKTFVGKNPYPPGEPIPQDLTGYIRHLPHIELEGATYFVTFHAIDGEMLDCQEQDMVFRACMHGDGKTCCVYALVVLGNHVHMVVRPYEGHRLGSILHSIKSFTSHEINKARGRSGPFWNTESFDHIIRDSRWLTSFINYICDNPVKYGLVKTFDQYRWLYINPNEVFVEETGQQYGIVTGVLHQATEQDNTDKRDACCTNDTDNTDKRDACRTNDTDITVYTTRPDTLFGATYMVLAPEHELVEIITTPDQRQAVQEYVRQAANKSELERQTETKEKTGVFTGAYAINPVNDQPIPIWVADYVMMGYGTGAIMAVPAHDTRDFEFATKFNLPIIQVVQPPEGIDWHGYTADGIAINSGKYDGLTTDQFKKQITADLAEQGLGKEAVNYKLRDWLFSRQRYWGEPFPIIHCDKCGTVALNEDQLPLTLPEMADFTPQASEDPDALPQPPLGKATDWVNTTCPSCGGPAKRELNTMPQWAGSCWYYLRYLDPHNDRAFCDRDVERYWMLPAGGENDRPAMQSPMGVDLYVGGAEHAVLHLLYARFWHKALFDLGHVSTPEPFGRLFNQGMIRSFAYRDSRGMCVGYDKVDISGDKPRHRETGEELIESVEKMSKSLKNVVNPDEVIEQYGADTFRLYEMFMGPLEASKPWNTRDVPGVHRFLQRVWRMIAGSEETKPLMGEQGATEGNTESLERPLHRLIKKVGEDIEAMKFNTAIAAMMEFVNLVYKAGCISQDQAERFVLLIAPFAPHLAEELWLQLGHAGSLSHEPWPKYDDALVAQESIEMPVQVNGKVRARINVAPDADEESILSAAAAAVADALAGKTIVKKIVVPNRLVNIVVR